MNSNLPPLGQPPIKRRRIDDKTDVHPEQRLQQEQNSFNVQLLDLIVKLPPILQVLQLLDCTAPQTIDELFKVFQASGSQADNSDQIQQISSFASMPVPDVAQLTMAVPNSSETTSASQISPQTSFQTPSFVNTASNSTNNGSSNTDDSVGGGGGVSQLPSQLAQMLNQPMICAAPVVPQRPLQTQQIHSTGAILDLPPLPLPSYLAQPVRQFPFIDQQPAPSTFPESAAARNKKKGNGASNASPKARTNLNISESALDAIKQREITGIRKRVRLRIEKITRVINETIRGSQYWCIINMYQCGENDNTFTVTDSIRHVITEQIVDKLKQWNGGRYRSQELSEHECYNKCRTYWNRQKAEELGDKLFAPLLKMAFVFVASRIGRLTEQHIILLFIEILQALSTATIQFDRSMARPLILNACYLKRSKYKDFCKAFAKSLSNDLELQSLKTTRTVKKNNKTTYEYIRDDNRSKQLKDAFDIIIQTLYQRYSAENVDLYAAKSGIESFSKWVTTCN